MVHSTNILLGRRVGLLSGGLGRPHLLGIALEPVSSWAWGVTRSCCILSGVNPVHATALGVIGGVLLFSRHCLKKAPSSCPRMFQGP